MPFRTLADFLEDLGRAGELAAVDAEVEAGLEMAEITRRVARQDGPALLFRRVRGHDMPVATNLLASEARILRALGAESFEEAAGRIDRVLNSGGGEGWLDRLRFGGKSGAAAGFAAARVKSGGCQQVVRIGSDVDLTELPLMCNSIATRSGGEDDASGRSAPPPVPHSAIFLSAEPETHAQLFLRGDLLVTGKDNAVVAWHEPADSSQLLAAYHRHGARMPLAVVIGGDPAVALAAAAPLPSAVDPLGLAGLLREKPLEVVGGRSIELLVPAESDVVVEGFLDPAERLSHLLHVTAVTHRASPVVPLTTPDIEGEAAFCNRAIARLFLPYVRQRIAALVDFDLPLSGGARRAAFLAIDKTYPGQARHVAAAAWSMRPFQFARLLVVIDANIDVDDSAQVLLAISQEANWKSDLWEFDGPADPLNLSAPPDEPSRRIAIDATRKLEGEAGFCRSRRMEPDDGIRQLVDERWPEYGLGPEEASR